MPEEYDIEEATNTLRLYLNDEGIFESLRRLQAQLDVVIAKMGIGSRLTVTLDKDQKHYRAKIHYEYPNQEHPPVDKIMLLGGLRYLGGEFVIDNGVDVLAMIADTVGSEIQNEILQHDFSAK